MPSNIQLCLQYISLPQGLTHTHETSCHTYNGLCQCSSDQDIVTRYTPCRRSQRYTQAYQISTTFNNAPAHIIGWHTPILSVPQNTSASSRWASFAPHRCTHTGQRTTTQNIWGLQPTSSTWQCTSSLQMANKYTWVTYDEMQVVMITEQQYSTFLHANGQYCKIDAPFQALTNLPPCIAALDTKNNQEIGVQCSLSVFHASPAFQPIITPSNLWIFILTPATQGSAVTMICPDKVTHSSLFQLPFHILKPPSACSATSRQFHPPP